ncbi:MAG: hypothetical protein IPP85_14225 [Propionivibrio sp.]|nr:hypothetical protein [Propionivibrio sp.]
MTACCSISSFEASPIRSLSDHWGLGRPNRVYAAFKFSCFTLLGSLLFPDLLIYLFVLSGGSFSILDWHQLPSPGSSDVIFLAFLVAFAVKVPCGRSIPWLPDAHVEAPTGGSIVLAAIALKLRGLRFPRFSLPIAPDASHELSGLIVGLSLIATVLHRTGGIGARKTWKAGGLFVDRPRVSVTLGFFMFSALGLEGALVQMISHGFIAGAMFYCIGVMYDRVHSRQIARITAVWSYHAQVRRFFMLFAMANAGLPATSVLSASSWSFLPPSSSISGERFAALSMIVGAAYTLWMYKRVVFGAVANHHVAELTDISAREFWF